MLKTDNRRVYKIHTANVKKGRIVYWMDREHRIVDNDALNYAYSLAIETESELAVAFCFDESYFDRQKEHFSFMVQGLTQVAKELEKFDIPMFFLKGEKPHLELEKFVTQNGVTTIVTDFNPLKIYLDWKEKVAKLTSIPFFEVDTHNIVPARFVSDKQEYAAYTIRPKINELLPEFLIEPDTIKNKFPHKWTGISFAENNIPSKVESVFGFEPGTKAAYKSLNYFISEKIKKYSTQKNDPNSDAVSNLSPYLHFGQISAKSIALQVKARCTNCAGVETFLEELIIRKELADNFCLYNKNYDNHSCMPNWAKKSFDAHKNDIRDYLYGTPDFELAKTHDALWNAAQMEMVKLGKMHGYARMYWAKKILEWTPSVEEAFETAVYLNDKYSLDGKDPNGYAGIAWSIVGVHDRPWFNRPVFGSVRYMSYNGCKSKFDVKKYIAKYII